ncbi:MAG: transglutaminase [Lysobacteraceae bacterium]
MRFLSCLLACALNVSASAQDVNDNHGAASTAEVANQGVLDLSPAPLSATLDDLLALPPALHAAFRAQVLDPHRAPGARIDAMIDFVFGSAGLGVRYDEAATHTVTQTWQSRRANCIGFTLLLLALARDAGLSAQPQEIRRTLVWQQSGGTLYRSSHVNLRLQSGPQRYTVDVARGRVVTLDEPVPIDDRRLLAHYHNNIAVRQMAQGRTAEALTRAEATLRIDPDYPTHWANAGVIRLRDGDADGAKQAYQRALALDADDYGALFNLVQLYDSRQDAAHAAPLRKRLESLQRKDPLHQFLLGSRHERDRDFDGAIERYQLAIRYHRGEHRFHAALARAYLANGDREQAIRSLSRAQSLSEGDDEAAYAALLDDLRTFSPGG